MQYVYAFEWCSSVYESGFSIESLHSTKVGAYKAMRKTLQERWNQDYEMCRPRMWRRHGRIPLDYQRWRVRKIEVFE